MFVKFFLIDIAFPGRIMSTGNVAADKARATSAEYWQKTAKSLSTENEELRKQLGISLQSRGVAVQEVLTQLFVEKVQDVPAVESIIDSPMDGELRRTMKYFSGLFLTVDTLYLSQLQDCSVLYWLQLVMSPGAVCIT